MKKMKSIVSVAFLLVILTSSMFAQTNSKVIAVINKAEWCPACKKNGERAMKTFKRNNKNGNFIFIQNDLTNDKTKLKSNKEIQKYGLLDVMTNKKSTAVVFFFNPVTKKLISKIGISKSDEELSSAMISALKGNKVVSKEEEEGGCN